MDQGVAVRPPGQTTGRFLLEVLALFAALAAPFIVLDPESARPVTAALALGYLAPFIYRGIRRSKGQPRIPWTLQVLAYFHVHMGALSAFALMCAAGAGWIAWAYPVERFETDPSTAALLSLVPSFASGATVVSLGLFGLSLGSLVLLRRRTGHAGGLPAPLRANGFRVLRAPLAELGFFMVVTGLLVLHAIVPIFDEIHGALTRDAEATILDLAAFFPFLPLGLLAAAALLVVTRPALFDECQVSSVLRWLRNGRDQTAAENDRLGRMVLVTAVGSAAIVAAVLYPIHIAMVAGYTAIKGASSMNATVTAAEQWIGEQRHAGASAAEIAAQLNRDGHWAPGSPDGGLAVLIPDGGFATDPRKSPCRVDIAADVADRDQVRGIEWIGAERAVADLKYCVKVSCPTHVAWDATPSLVLYSSHASRNLYWMESAYVDVFAEGAAAQPGGYCTAAGDLADDYQG